MPVDPPRAGWASWASRGRGFPVVLTPKPAKDAHFFGTFCDFFWGTKPGKSELKVPISSWGGVASRFFPVASRMASQWFPPPRTFFNTPGCLTHPGSCPHFSVFSVIFRYRGRVTVFVRAGFGLCLGHSAEIRPEFWSYSPVLNFPARPKRKLAQA